MPLSISSTQTAREFPPPDISDVKEDLDQVGTDHIQFPEGGTAAWCMVIGGALVEFCGFGYISAFGVYQDFYARHYLSNESSSAISWIGSTNAFLATGFGLVAGTLYDRGYFCHLLIGGSILQSSTLFMLSLTRSGQYYQIFLAQGISLGIAQGILYVPTMGVVSQYFHRRRTLAMSLVASGSSFGSVIHPIMLNYLFNRSVGFANGVRMSAALVSVFLLVACLLIRTRFKSTKRPADYLSVGKGILDDMPFCIMCVGLFCINTGTCFPLFYLQLDSVQHRNSETFSFYSLVLLNGGSLIGRLSTGFIAPHVDVHKLMILTTAMCGALILGMMSLSHIPTIVVLGTIYGYFSGIYFALLSPLIALTGDISELGARMGIAMTALAFGGLIGTLSLEYLVVSLRMLLKGGPISGALLTSQYKWWQPALFSGLITLVGSALLVVMQVALARRKCSTGNQTPSTLGGSAGQEA